MTAYGMQHVASMPTPERSLQILWIRSWIEPAQPLREALGDAGYRANFTRVDNEPALHAAITRGDFELAIVDDHKAGLARGLVETRFREHGVRAPLLDHGASATLVRRIEEALAQSQ